MKRWKVRIHVCTFGHWHRERKKERQLICTKQNNVCVATQSTQYSPTSPCSSLSHRNGMDLHKTQSKWTNVCDPFDKWGLGTKWKNSIDHDILNITTHLPLPYVLLFFPELKNYWKCSQPEIFSFKKCPQKVVLRTEDEDWGWGNLHIAGQKCPQSSKKSSTAGCSSCMFFHLWFFHHQPSSITHKS